MAFADDTIARHYPRERAACPPGAHASSLLRQERRHGSRAMASTEDYETEAKRLLRHLSGAADLFKGDFGSDTRGETAARIGEAGAFALIQSYVGREAENPADRRSAMVEAAARIGALVLALGLFGAAVGTYIGVTDRGA